MATQAVSIASALISGPLRMANMAAAGTSMVLASEIGLRTCLTLSHGFQNGELPKDWQFKDKSGFSERIVDFRQLTRNLEAEDLFRTLLISTVTTMVITELNFVLFGAPIKGINMFGRAIGVQTTNNGIWANLDFSDWKDFAKQPV